MATRAFRRFTVLMLVVGALLAFTGAHFATPPASADGLATVTGCNPASGSSTGTTCNLQLNYSFAAGGMWQAAISDTSATLTACDGSASSATCTYTGNTATFTCPSGCAQSSKYSITVSGTSNAQNESFTSISAGTLPGVSTVVSSANTPVVNLTGPAYAAPAVTTVGPAVTTVVAAVPAGNQCVNGSYPTSYGCTSSAIGPFGAGGYGGYGAYGGYGGYGAYGGYGTSCYGLYYGCGFNSYPAYNSYPFYNYGSGLFNGGCLGLWTLCGGSGRHCDTDSHRRSC